MRINNNCVNLLCACMCVHVCVCMCMRLFVLFLALAGCDDVPARERRQPMVINVCKQNNYEGSIIIGESERTAAAAHITRTTRSWWESVNSYRRLKGKARR